VAALAGFILARHYFFFYQWDNDVCYTLWT
jgi:hypothetical protein